MIVVTRIVCVGRWAPQFIPQVQRLTISEHALSNNTIIHLLIVSDPLSLNSPQQQQQQDQHHQHNHHNQRVLMFEPCLVEGLEKNSQPMTGIKCLESMISVPTNTADVVVNSNLNHELAAYTNLTLYASYRPEAVFDSHSLHGLIGQNTANPTADADPSSNAPSQMTAQLAGDEFRPRSVGYLIISVMDNNDHAPYFAAPWTPSQPELSYQMLEELPVGSILTQLVANDADSKISHYEIDPPNEYFELSSPKSGIIVNKKVIDYDTLMRQTYLSPGAHRVAQSASSSTTSMLQPTTGAGAPSAALILQSNTNNGNNVIQFNVIVYDSGVKQLAAKAIVSVEILPINDNDCKFDYQLYEVNLKENALPDTVVTQVRASDLDVGEEHNSISYHLVGDQKDYFNIDARTGVITVSKRGSIGLDREQLAKPIITLTVVGRDNYQLARAGLGDGSGDQSDASNFRQSRGRTSQVPSSANSLGGSGGSRSCSTTLRIHVEDVNDNPPLFAQKIYEVVAYDIDTKDAPLVKLIVHDDDSKHNTIPAPLSVRGGNTNNNGLLSSSTSSSSSNNNNSYRIVSGNFNDSFNITQSGMIYVTRPLNETLAALDRHDASSSSSGTGNPVIELKVEVRQQGFVPPSGASLGAPQTAVVADECLVRVTIMKINRHPPDWRSETNFIPIEENLRPGSLVTQLRCIDRDFEPAKSSPSSSSWVTHYDVQQQLTTAGQQHTQTNGAGRARQSANQLASSAGDNRRPSPIRYWIKENGVNVLETSEFRLDSVSGNLVTRVALDREKRSDYWLLVACEDNGRPESFETITSLYIAVSDVDDNKPEFLIDGQQQQQQRNAVSISREPQGPSSRAANTASSSQHHKPAAIKTITFVVDEQQSKGLQVGELKAIDRDLKPEQPISYCLLEGNEFQEFVLDELTGVLYTNQTLDREKQAYYDLLVKAINDGQSCDDHLAAWSAATSGGQSTNNNSSTAASIVTTTTKKPGNSSPESSVSTMLPDTTSMVKVRVELQDINDNAPVFRRHTFRAGVHHRALSGTLVTQVAAFDPDNEANGTLTYKISEILLYKTNPIASSTFSAGSSKYTSGYSQYQHHNSHHNHQHQTPSAIKLVQLPFRIDQQGNIYTQQLLTQYQLMSWFDVKIEATETTEPWRTATTRLEIYVYETNNQLKIRINLHPRLIESHRHEVETLLSNATKYTAIINRARSYNTNNNMDFAAASNNMANTKSLLDRSGSSQAAAKIPTLDLSQTPSDQYYRQQQVPFSADMSEPVQSSNIHAIFVDQHRLVNPNLVMEKFDLTSAQLLLSAHNFAGQPSELMGPVGQQQQQSSNWQDTNGNNELAPLIDRVALASIQAAEYQASPSGLAGIDWLESPSVLFVCLSSMLFFIGLLICLVGCCCTSRIKDHIIKVAMDKLVKQQALQAKINERVLAATNQAAYASTNGAGSVLGGVSGQQQQHPNNHLMNGAGHDFMLAQGAGFMSSFDATKGCLNNNYENMSILQRAMEAGEFFDPNYTTLNNNNNNTMTTPAGHLNLGAHYYDASELDNQQEDDNGTGLDANNADKQYQMMNGAGAMDNSVVSLSLEEEYDDDDDEDGDRDMNDGSGNNYDMTTNANSGDLSNGHDTQQKLAKETKLYTNGLNGMVSSHHSRLRQQIPNNKYSHDT
uniref:Cadherin-87A n=1 Tax=Aceria tosichella TaxID=561515 RepID=A0A6G1SEU7_9ACAR